MRTRRAILLAVGLFIGMAVWFVTAETKGNTLSGSTLLVHAASSQTVTCTTQEQLESALLAASTDSENPTVIMLGADIEISGQITVAAGTYVQLQSAGNAVYTLTEQTKFANKELAGLLYVQGNLILSRITVDANYNGRAAIVDNDAVLTLDTGASLVKGMETGFRSAYGIGVYVKNGSKTAYGTLIMNDGSKIAKCQTQGKGAQKALGIGVYVGTYGQFLMNGGEISENLDVGNTAATSACACGGGVYIENYVTFTMNGGKISENRAYCGGGGIYISGSNNSSIMTMSGNAEISNNISMLPENYSNYGTSGGGGIYMESGTLYLKEQALISGNIAQTNMLTNYSGCGGGIFVNSGTVYMEGGSICENMTDSIYQAEDGENEEDCHATNGGGVYIKKGFFEMSGGSISGNTANRIHSNSLDSGNGGGICLGFEAEANGASGGTVILHGGIIEKNLAQNCGSGVYLSNLITITVNSNRTDETQKDVIGAPVLQLGQSPVIWENEGDNLYLPALEIDEDTDQNAEICCLYIDSAFIKDAAKIGIVTESRIEEDIIIAKPTEQYVLRNNDANVFVYEGENNKGFSIDDNGYLILGVDTQQDKIDLSEAEVSIHSAIYDGSVQKPEAQVVYQGQTLVKGTDYTASYLNNINAGTAQVVINGKGSYTGTAEKEFEILPRDIAEDTITISDISDKYYTGSPLLPEVRIYIGDTELIAQTDNSETYDYTVSYGENIQSGTNAGIVTITGYGNYTGSRMVYFNIIQDSSARSVSNETELIAALEQETVGTPTKIVLGADISLTQEIALSDKTSVWIIGNGFTISMTEKNLADNEHADRAMLVLNNSVLKLSDIQFSGENKSRILYIDKESSLIAESDVVLTKGMAASSSNISFGGQCIYNEGTVSFFGIIEKSYNGYYGVIYNNGTFNMESGSCIQDVKTTMGGAVYNAENGTFQMKGSKLLHVSGFRGNGAAVSNFGNMTIDSSLIKGCECSVSAVYNEGSLTMQDSQVTENQNTSILQEGQSGGTLYQKAGTFIMTDSQVLGNVTCTGGGVFVDGGTFTMEGTASQIVENTATYNITSATNVEEFGNGGGVFLNNGNFVMKAGSICNNQAGYQTVTGKKIEFSGNGGGVLINGGTFTILGGTIAENQALDADTAGIYLNHAIIGSSVKDDSALKMSGSADVQDVIYLANGYSIELLDAVWDSVLYHIVQENTNIGAPAVVYRTLDAGESEFMQEADAQKFISQNTKKEYEVSIDSREIVLARQDLSTCAIRLTETQYEYTGKNIVPDIEIQDIDGNVVREYDIKGTNINVGSAKVTIQGDGYTTTGSVDVEYEIAARELSSKGITVALDKSTYEYSQSKIIPDITVKYGNTTLKEGTDYTVTVQNNINVGTAEVVITGKGNFTGTVTKTFSIKKKQTITGSSYKKPYSSSTFILNAKTDGNGKLTYSSSNTKVATVNSTGKVTLKGVGTAKITVKAAATSTYLSASKTITITVVKGTQNLSAATVYNKTYGGKAFTLNVKRTAGNGKLSYKSANTNIVKVNSKGKVTITGCGRTTITVKAAGTSLYNQASKKITITVAPKKPTLSSVKNQKGKKMVIRWKKDTKISGYQIQYATDKNFKKNIKTATIQKKGTLNKTITGLKKGTTYYVRIRSYKLVNGQALFGEYSARKSVKIRK